MKNMRTTPQAEKAKIFLKLHYGHNLLILPNIWDPIGARILESKGYPAVATASSAISASLGYEDGEKIKLSTHTEIIERIVRSVNIPVSADIESGYSSSISGLKESLGKIINTGIAGINIEDSIVEGETIRPIDEQCERITLIREISTSFEIHLVINARIDLFLTNLTITEEEKINETIKRAEAYRKCGADCIYVIGNLNLETLIQLRKEITIPINVLVTDKSESLRTLKKIGINRVSFGPYIFRSCMKKFVQVIDELYEFGNNEYFAKEILSYSEMNNYLRKEKE